MKGVPPDVPLGTVFKGILPFVIAGNLRLFVLASIPALVMFLPKTMR